MAYEPSDQIRQVLQQSIQDCLHSFHSSSMHEREDLNTLLSFYRAMHAMSLQAIKLERSLQGRLSVSNNRLERPAAEENPDLQQPRRNASGIGAEASFGEAGYSGQGGITHVILDFGRS